MFKFAHAQPAQQSPFRIGARGAGVSLLTVAITGLGLMTAILADHDVAQAFAATWRGWVVIGLGALPALLWLVMRQREQVPLYVAHGLFYSLCFGAASFFPIGMSIRPDTPRIDRALELTMLALVGMHIGYYAVGWVASRALTPLRIAVAANPQRIARVGTALALIGLVPSLTTLPTIGRLLLSLAWVGKGLLLELLMSGKVKGVLPVTGVVLLFASGALLGLASGAIAPAGLTLLFAAAIIALRAPGRSLLLVAAAPIVFVVLQPVKSIWRNSFWRDPLAAQASIAERAAGFESIATGFWASGDMALEAAQQPVFVRLDHIGLTAAVMDATPTTAPFRNGETVKYVLTSWIPRVLWRTKPLDDLGNRWAHWYGFLAWTDVATSQNLPWLTELYFNFGTLGTVMGMMLFGIIFRLLSRWFFSPESNVIAVILGASLCLDLFWAESNITTMWSDIPTRGVLLWLIVPWLLRARTASVTNASPEVLA